MFIVTGIFKSIMQWVFDFGNILGVKKLFKEGIAKNVFHLCNSNVDFLPTTMLKEEKTTG